MKKLTRKLLQTPLFTHNPTYRWVYRQQIQYHIPNLIDKPRRIIVENTNLCNLDCSFCPNSKMKRPKGVMPYEKFCRIVNECHRFDIPHLYHFGIGEPLLDKEYLKKCEYAHCKIKDTHCVTNGITLDTIPAVDYLGITINDETVIPNVEAVWKKRKGKLPEIECRLKPSTGYLKPRLKKICDKVNIYENVTNWGNIIKGNVPQGLKFPCSDLWTTLFITWEGKIALCCKDYDCEEPIGDLNKQTIKDIWQGNALKNKRELHLKNVYNGICENCDSNNHIVNPLWIIP